MSTTSSSTSSSINASMIDAACAAFHKSVSAYIAKSRKFKRCQRYRGDVDDGDHDESDVGSDNNDNATSVALKQHIHHLVDHANHVLRTLTAKRHSLTNALVAFREASNLHVQQFGIASAAAAASIKNDNTAVEDRQRQILRTWFANYIRLRDGFVLLESGERRQPHDDDDDLDNTAKSATASFRNKQFESKLKGAYRSDGITRKFSSNNGYTGTGYDEVYDEDVGIKYRLLEALSNLDCNGQKRRSVASINEKLFDGENYGNGAQLWEGLMDEHIRDSKVLRDTLNSIQVKFVNDINHHLMTTGGSSNVQGSDRGGRGVASVKKMKLILITDDKFERMTLGDLVDIARQGNAFTLQDAGGSLPIGMTVDGWRQRFGLIPAVTAVAQLTTSSSRVEKVTMKKKRKVILEDSSDEDEEDEAGGAAASSKKNKAVPTKQMQISTDPAIASTQKCTTTTTTTNDNDGLTVRMRKATDVSDKGKSRTGEDFTSIDEMKRQLGVNNAQLERGREMLEDEQLLSKIAADEEDMREEMLRDESATTNTHHGNNPFSAHAALLRKIYTSRNELRKKNVLSYNNTNDIELLRESQEYWAVFDESVIRWNDQFQALGEMRKEISDGMLDESSDRAYTIRENFREANMLLGIDSMEVYEFYSQLEKEKPTTQNRCTGATSITSSSSTPPDDALFDVCISCLKFAEETFKTALSLVLENERSQTNSPATIDRHWEKGQHLLLRGRAHHNIGHAIYERAEYTHKLCNRQQQLQQRQRGKDRTNANLLKLGKDEFTKAVQRARSIRHNTVMIYGHPSANDTSSQSNYTWMAEATIHKLEAMKLEMLASGFHVLCSWKDSIEEAIKIFHEVVESVEISDVANLASTEGVSPAEVAELLGDMYWHAMRVAELSTQSLECLFIGKDWNEKRGEDLLQLTRVAMKRASAISEHLLSVVNRHSLLEYAKELGIATPADISKEESEIYQWWQTIKKQATTRLSDVANTQHRLATLQRGEVAAGITGVVAAPLTRRVFFQDDRALQDRSLSCRTTRRVKKKTNADDDRNVAEQFSSEFAPTNHTATSGFPSSNSFSSSTMSNLHPTGTTIVYRKWGNEILEPHERKKRCCPPLPENYAELGISIDVIRALEKKLENILPAGHSFQ